MPLTIQRPRDINIVRTIAIFGWITRSQIGRWLRIPDRIQRRRLNKLTADRYVNQYVPDYPPRTPIYYSSQLGLSMLQEEEGDEFLLVNTRMPQTQNVWHFQDTTETHMAFRSQSDVRLVRWINPYHPVELDEPLVHKHRHTIFTRFDEKTCCSPDSIFALEYNGATCFFAGEVDRQTTTSAERTMRRKMSGYCKFHETKMHRRDHFLQAFPNALDALRVLFVCPNARRRDSLARTTHQLVKGPSSEFADIFRFVDKHDVTGNFLHEPIARTVFPQTELLPLVQRVKKDTEAA